MYQQKCADHVASGFKVVKPDFKERFAREVGEVFLQAANTSFACLHTWGQQLNEAWAAKRKASQSHSASVVRQRKTVAAAPSSHPNQVFSLSTPHITLSPSPSFAFSTGLPADGGCSFQVPAASGALIPSCATVEDRQGMTDAAAPSAAATQPDQVSHPLSHRHDLSADGCCSFQVPAASGALIPSCATVEDRQGMTDSAAPSAAATQPDQVSHPLSLRRDLSQFSPNLTSHTFLPASRSFVFSTGQLGDVCCSLADICCPRGGQPHRARGLSIRVRLRSSTRRQQLVRPVVCLFSPLVTYVQPSSFLQDHAFALSGGEPSHHLNPLLDTQGFGADAAHESS